MRRLPGPALFALGAVSMLMLGGTAYAANGGYLVIGRSNTATAATSLSNSTGSALSLNSAAGYPSLKVNRATKVPNLNADLLDGINSKSFVWGTGSVRGRAPVNVPFGQAVALGPVGSFGSLTGDCGDRLAGRAGVSFTPTKSQTVWIWDSQRGVSSVSAVAGTPISLAQVWTGGWGMATVQFTSGTEVATATLRYQIVHGSVPPDPCSFGSQVVDSVG